MCERAFQNKQKANGACEGKTQNLGAAQSMALGNSGVSGGGWRWQEGGGERERERERERENETEEGL